MGRRILTAMECALCGAVLGMGFTLFLFRRPVGDFSWGLVAGGVGGGALLYVLTHPEGAPRRRDTAILAVACLVPGLFLADHLRTDLSPALAATLGLLWSGLWCGLAAWFQARLVGAGWYTRYHGELAVVLACSTAGSVAGHFLARGVGGATSPWGEGLHWVLPALLAVTASLIPGAALSRQPYRPVLGSLLGFISGGLVLWFGVQVAPMLFLPGSGLLWAGTVIGIAILVAASLPVIYPKSALVTGLIMVGLSILSFIGATGGLLVGGLLGILAGAMFASWEGQPHGLGVARPIPRGQETTSVVTALGNDEEPAESPVAEEQSHEASG